MSEHGWPESSQEVWMPKKQRLLVGRNLSGCGEMKAIVDGFGKCIKLWSRMSEYEDDLKFSKKIVVF